MKNLFSAAAIGFIAFTTQAQVTYSLVTAGLTSVTFGSGPSEVEVGDMDGDGDLDIVTIGDHGSPNIGASEGGIMVWKNNGSGTNWSMTKTGNFGYGGIAVGDVNNDGKMDLGYGMHHNNSSTDFGDGVLEVVLGDGSGSNWTVYDDSLGAQGQSWGMFGVDFGDLDNDGLLDIGSNGFGCCDGIWLYKNLGNGTWKVTDGNLGGNSNHQYKMGDFNNDGHIDCATANEWGQVWRNTGGGVITYMQNGIPADAFMTFDLGDVNNDGAKDIAIESSGSAKVYTYNKSTGTWQSISTGLPAAGVEGIELADMDMDGNCDLVVWSSAAITIYKGDGTGGWTASTTIANTLAQYGMSSSATGDFNHDGYTDLVFLGKASGSNTMRVYLSNVSSPSLTLLPVFPKGYECFVGGSVQFIHWLSSVPAGPAATVTIEFSSSGPGGPWTTVAGNAPNSGIYQWTVPSASSSSCHLKFTISNGTSSQVITTSNPFGIGTCSTPTSSNETESVYNELSVYPNPMNGSGYIQFTLDEPCAAEILLLDLAGKVIGQIAKEVLTAGMHRIHLDAGGIPSGIYLVKIKAGDKILNAKAVIAN